MKRTAFTSVLLLLFAQVVALAALVLPAQADVLNYPWSNASDVNPATYEWGYATCPNNDAGCMTFKGARNGTVYGEADPWNYYLRSCTSYVAWKLTSLGVPASYVTGLGNGGNWYDNAVRKGVPTGTTPQVGDAAVWPAGTFNNPYGHVAYVESVNADGTIRVTEYNYYQDGTGDTRQGKPTDMHFTKFVHFASLMTNPPVTPAPQPPTPHLYEVQHSLTNSGMTEVRGLNASNNYQSWLGGWVTPDGLHGGDAVDYGMADANGDGTQDIYKMQYGYTNSGMTEVMVLNGAQHFTGWVGGWVTADPYHAAGTVHYAVGNFDGDTKPDVFVILTMNTPSGHVEVKVLTGSSNYSQWAGGWVTPEGWHDSAGVDYVLSSCGTNGGRPNLYEIQHSATSSGMTEIKELDGGTFYQSYVGGWVTPDGLHDGDSVNYTAGGCNANGKPNIYEVIHQYTSSGMTEVRELDGSKNFSAWIGGWVTPDGWHSGNGIDYVMPMY